MAAVMERTTSRHRQGWLGAEFDRDRLYWDFKPAHLAAIDELMEKRAGDRRPFHQITKRDFSHPALDADLADLLGYIKAGPGLVVMRGFPVGTYTPEEMQTVYWGIGAHFGIGCSQSADGDYLGHVTNVEKASRGYTTARELSLHTDSAEIVGLLCVRDAQEGGMSIYANSLKVHEIVAREHPEYLAVLERGFRCDRRGEEAPGDAPVTPYRVPVFSEVDGLLSTRFVRGVIDRGAERLGEPLSDLEKAALAFFEEAALRDDVRLELRLAPGEASFINNYEMLHARTGFIDHDDPAKKRLLYRLWLMGDPPRPMKREVHLYQNRSGRMGVDPQPGRGPR
ncbi:MAG TPA: TauD/TfdA family dioxygenase [Stellaceae bacterium]|nr:TauD/TfdA family dioxygenase [Stellaceae bacterium]